MCEDKYFTIKGMTTLLQK